MLNLSTLPKTWIFDVDGTIVKHNGYLIDGYDTLLDGVKEFFNKLSDEDFVVFLTARKDDKFDDLKDFLHQNGIRFDCIITNIPVGERILINDTKPSGLKTAYSVNKKRDEPLVVDYVVKEDL